MAKERQMSAYEVNVEHEGVHGVDAANEDIEHVGHEGTLENVNDGEDEGPHGNVGKPDLVLETVRDHAEFGSLRPGQVDDARHDQEAGQDQLNWSLDAASNAV